VSTIFPTNSQVTEKGNLMFLETQGTRLFVSSFGAGDRTALALGGWIGSGEMWLPVLGRLNHGWRTVTFDQRASGTSHVPNDRDITRKAWVDDVFAVMDAQGIERCLVMSDSSGCFPAVLAASKCPERFAGLVLIGGRPECPWIGSGNSLGWVFESPADLP
jgi:pimeloyl-ACP methyl ester carboxylesterase